MRIEVANIFTRVIIINKQWDVAQWFFRVSFVDTLSSCLARTFSRDPLRSSRRLKMSYRLTAVYLSAGGHHGFVRSYRGYERESREGGMWPRHSLPRLVKHVRHPDLVHAFQRFVPWRERSYIDPSTWKRRNNMDLSFRRRSRRLFHASDICHKYHARHNTNIKTNLI